MIPFNKPPRVGTEERYIAEALNGGKICGDGSFSNRCSEWLKRKSSADAVLLTTSCTHALELAALLAGIRPGDEIIMPSYTFVSTANAFVLRGGVPVFVDVRPDTMNIDETLIEAAITPRTRAIVPVHYAGAACEMDTIMDVAKRYGLLVIEDAAQGVMSTYKGRALGSIGDIGCYSFHETKNYSMGEGGAILINNPEFTARAEIIREKGTNRRSFLRGMTDKYTWVDIGSSYLPGDILAAHLWAQLEAADAINEDRLRSWRQYMDTLAPLAAKGLFELQTDHKQYEHYKHNAHMLYIKLSDIKQRTRLTEQLKARGITAAFHYVPLHSSEAGRRFGRMHGSDVYTTRESERLLRLPTWYGIEKNEILAVCGAVSEIISERMATDDV